MRVRDIMTRAPTTASPQDTVSRAAGILAARGFTALPVVDGAGQVVGIVSEADLIDDRYPGPDRSPAHAPNRTVADVMTAPAICVIHDADVAVLARLMVADHLRSVPVVDGSRLVGIVTRRDVLHVLSRPDSQIATTVLDNLAVLGGRERWTVQVADGVVTMHDAFQEAGDREVARVLAEAVPGVVRVAVVPAEQIVPQRV